MTETPIRRRPDGSIDTGFYMDCARQLRSAELRAMAGATGRSLRRSHVAQIGAVRLGLYARCRKALGA